MMVSLPTRLLSLTSSQCLLAVTGVMLAGVMVLTGCETTKTVKPGSASTKAPVLDATASKDDFAFPSIKPKLSVGKALFMQKCTHFPKWAISPEYVAQTKPIDQYLAMTHGEYGCGGDMTRDQRWSVIFYSRYLAGDANIHMADIQKVFGANCAVCHGTKGQADGTLYTGHASHKLGMAPRKNAFYPPPANFTDYGRMYNRTNVWLTQLINEGSYPSAMPPWRGWKNPTAGYEFNDALVSDLVKYVRQFAYDNDLPADEMLGPKPELMLQLSPQLSSAPRQPSSVH